MSVVVRRYIDILIIIITFPYNYTNSTCISPFLGSIIPISLFIKYFFILYIYIEDRNLNLKSKK